MGRVCGMYEGVERCIRALVGKREGKRILERHR